MHLSLRRERLRKHLAGGECVRPASVFDPVSARIADSLGFEFGMLGGSVASAVILGAPDLAVVTLTELADQCRRIARASDISLVVDADNGYGNALSVMRTVEELEDAGVSGMTIEDTALPQSYGRQGSEELISVEEMTGKLRAAVRARRDPATVLIGRTHALAATSLDDAVERVKAIDATGVDAVFLLGVKSLDQLEAARTGDRPALRPRNDPSRARQRGAGRLRREDRATRSLDVQRRSPRNLRLAEAPSRGR